MDRSDEIEQLTTQLRNVSLRLAQLEAAASRENNRSSAETAAAPSSNTTAAAPSSAETAAALSSATTRAAAPIIQKGDRLRITNKVNKPRNWPGEWDQDKAQKATVTHFYRGQVHFITDNGVRTWRAVNNLAKEE
ncbi:hypothetical protein MHU86_4338 [Fragilaria crotonensis]|nr:hypothetical protein MHU86_4338 [Fragilaria crotonensis]